MCVRVSGIGLVGEVMALKDMDPGGLQRAFRSDLDGIYTGMGWNIRKHVESRIRAS